MKNTMYSALSLLLLVVLAVPACDWFKKKAQKRLLKLMKLPSQNSVSSMLTLMKCTPMRIFQERYISAVDRIEETAKDWNKETPVVVYCSDYSCQASHSAAKKLTD